MKTPRNSPFHRKRNPSTSSCPVFWSTRQAPCTRPFAADLPSRRSSTARSRGSVRATAPRSRTSSAPSPTRSSTSSSSNPKVARRTNTTSTASRRHCPGTCSGGHCTRSAGWRMYTSTVRATPSNTTIFRRHSCTIRSKQSSFRDSSSPDRSTARRDTRRRPPRG